MQKKQVDGDPTMDEKKDYQQKFTGNLTPWEIYK